MSIDIRNLPPHVRVAKYNTNQRIARYRGNKLIEALPASMSEEEILASLVLEPDFPADARDWESHLRINELLGLTNFMVPLTAHIHLALTIDSMLREGYVGRRPLSPDHVAVYQHIHSLEREDKPFRQSADTRTPRLSTALIGVSGMGKTTTVERVLARIPPVYYHPDLDIFQVTYLHFEMPSDGKGVKSLAMAIIQRLDELIPGSNYYDKYIGNRRPSADALIRVAARLMNKHCVGLLIPDEVQNVGNARKDERILMSELTSLCNQCKVPQLYIGTNKAYKILGLDFGQGRRSVGLGLGDWGPMPECEYKQVNGEWVPVPGEWVDFVNELWRYQWTKNPAELTPVILATLYDCTQGVIDLVIKLFIVAQARAILDQTEVLTDELLKDVYQNNMELIHPMVDALRSGDVKALMRYEDIAPPNAEDLVNDLQRRYRNRRNPAASVRPGAIDFQPRLAAAARVLGLPPEDADAVAKEVAADGSAKNMLDAARQMAKKLTVPKPVARKSTAKSKEAAVTQWPDLTDRPLDYRNAIAAAAREQTTVLQQLVAMNMVQDVEELVCLA